MTCARRRTCCTRDARSRRSAACGGTSPSSGTASWNGKGWRRCRPRSGGPMRAARSPSRAASARPRTAARREVRVLESLRSGRRRRRAITSSRLPGGASARTRSASTARARAGCFGSRSPSAPSSTTCSTSTSRTWRRRPSRRRSSTSRSTTSTSSRATTSSACARSTAARSAPAARLHPAPVRWQPGNSPPRHPRRAAGPSSVLPRRARVA